MLSRHMSNDNEEADFPLYPDPQNMFTQGFPFNTVQNFNMDASFSYTRTQEGCHTSTGMRSANMYAEAPQYSHSLSSPEMQAVSSNYSTASAPSATSSAMGSPHSIHGHIVPVPEWAPQGLGLNPSIVNYDNYGPGNEYTYQPQGMDDFALEFNPAKPNGFVGECQNISRSRQHGSISSNCESISSLSTFLPSPNTLDTPTKSDSATRSIASPITPLSAIRTDPRDDCFKSPSVSAFSRSPSSSRRPSQAFNAPLYASSSAASRTQEMRLSPVSAISQSLTSEPSPSYATYHQSHFFSQSSGNFVPPLESSCRFPLSILPYDLPSNLDGSKLLTSLSSDPSILHPQYAGRPNSATQSNETSVYPPPTYPASPSLSMSRSPRLVKQDSQSPYLGSYGGSSYPYPPPRRPSLASHQSCSSQDGFSSEESKEKGRCTYQECGKVFKDLKAHMLTHQNERPGLPSPLHL
jgi:hypothetical protein